MSRPLALVATLVVLLVTAATLSSPLAAPAASAASARQGWGRVHADDQTLRHGCHRYAFDYRVSVPGEEWMAEFTLVAPDGQKVASRTLDSQFRGDRGTANWRLCDSFVAPGRHAITLKLTSVEGREQRTARVPPASFRLTR